jgi:hypothetical protein
MKYKMVKNLKWANEEHTIINCDVDFDDLIEEFVPFSATADDIYEHTKEIFNKAINGDFGEIEEYSKPYYETEEGREELRIEFELKQLEQANELKAQILELNPTARFPNDVDTNNDEVASIEELQAYLDLLKQRALINKFEG